MAKVHNQPSFVLLSRPYSESSWITEIFSRDYGRLALMAKGARRPKSKMKGVLLPFQPLLLSWSGKGEIPTLTAAEFDFSGDYSIVDHSLKKHQRICAFYCNELLMILLHRHDPHEKLFSIYTHCLTELCSSESQATVLRKFEQAIIKQAGYGLNLHYAADGTIQIQANLFYRFRLGSGFVRCSANSIGAYSGELIQGLSSNAAIELRSDQLSQQRELMRDIIEEISGKRKIVSRELFYR